MTGKDWLALIGFVALSQAAGVVGSLFTVSNIPSWYATLLKPELAPPNWVFGPVWTTLYLLMGIAAFLVWRRGVSRPAVHRALVVFYLQLAINVLWSVLFFGFQSPLLGLFDIAALWLAIALSIKLFYKVSPRAAYILLPYLAWVSFASYLNFMIWSLN